jgi:hypothetical protein
MKVHETCGCGAVFTTDIICRTNDEQIQRASEMLSDFRREHQHTTNDGDDDGQG